MPRMTETGYPTHILVLILSLFVLMPAGARGGQSVLIGVNGPELDACGSLGRISGLDVDGDNFLSVRAAPSGKAQEIDRLTSGKDVWMCQTSTDQKWIGIIYGSNGQDCGVASPTTKQQPYRGPCKSGWVFHRYVEAIAG